jgi:esterase/lipase superfamily enzyme
MLSILGVIVAIILIGYLIFLNYHLKKLAEPSKFQKERDPKGSADIPKSPREDKSGEVSERDSQSTRGLPQMTEMEPGPQGEIARVNVFYGTDRQRTGSSDPSEIYGGDRNIVAENEDPLEYGICEISIPPNHKVGEIETPKWWKLEFWPDPEKHVILQQVDIESKDSFFLKMAETVQASERKEAFIFIHGYNTSFEEAALRTGQMAFDLGFDGAPIMYTWPSRGDTAAYLLDGESANWTGPHFKQFLLDVRDRSGADTIHLIAHSMGNRVLARAFAELSEVEEQAISEKFKNVILTAPDIDAEVFKNEIAPAILKSQSHITLYASSNDLALEASQKLHGYPRAGDSDHDDLVVIFGIETIDATGVNTSFLGHSYFAESPYILSDIYRIIDQGLRASERVGLVAKEDRFGTTYWIANEIV